MVHVVFHRSFAHVEIGVSTHYERYVLYRFPFDVSLVKTMDTSGDCIGSCYRPILCKMREADLFGRCAAAYGWKMITW